MRKQRRVADAVARAAYVAWALLPFALVMVGTAWVWGWGWSLIVTGGVLLLDDMVPNRRPDAGS